MIRLQDFLELFVDSQSIVITVDSIYQHKVHEVFYDIKSEFDFSKLNDKYVYFIKDDSVEFNEDTVHIKVFYTEKKETFTPKEPQYRLCGDNGTRKLE